MTGGRPTTLVVCIGNDLVADDAIGYDIYETLKTRPLPGHVRLEYAAVGGLSLLDRFTGDEDSLIVVDAVAFGAEPGTVHCLAWDEIPRFSRSSISVHDVGLKDTIAIGRALYPEKIPPKIRLVGIEGRCFNRMREFMTPETAAALKPAVECVLDMIIQET
ncbi:hydrogenase maturation protease [Desulfatiferula olefinivorans]